MFNFTSSETKALLFTVTVLMVSGAYQLISPRKSLLPSIDYSKSDSVFRRLSSKKNQADSLEINKLKQKFNNTNTDKKGKKFYTKPRKKEQLSLSSININTATEMELQKLPRIGPTMSKRIIEYRNRIGKFNKINDLINVKGIGKKTLDKLKPYLIIN